MSDCTIRKAEEFLSNLSHSSELTQQIGSFESSGRSGNQSFIETWSSKDLEEVFTGAPDEMVVVRNTFLQLRKLAEVDGYYANHRFISAPAAFGIPPVSARGSSPVVSRPVVVPETHVVEAIPSPASQTTIMVRNIPTRISSKTFTEVVLASDPSVDDIDFIYLPIDFKTNKNLGYCFINFKDTAHASAFSDKYNDKKYVFCDTSEKKLKINWSNRQGFVKNLEVFTQTKMLDTWPAQFRPLAQWKDELVPIDSQLLSSILGESAFIPK
jgi:hypothetical protein